jgi:hypothetical protein
LIPISRVFFLLATMILKDKHPSQFYNILKAPIHRGFFF